MSNIISSASAFGATPPLPSNLTITGSGGGGGGPVPPIIQVETIQDLTGHNRLDFTQYPDYIDFSGQGIYDIPDAYFDQISTGVIRDNMVNTRIDFTTYPDYIDFVGQSFAHVNNIDANSLLTSQVRTDNLKDSSANPRIDFNSGPSYTSFNNQELINIGSIYTSNLSNGMLTLPNSMNLTNIGTNVLNCDPSGVLTLVPSVSVPSYGVFNGSLSQPASTNTYIPIAPQSQNTSDIVAYDSTTIQVNTAGVYDVVITGSYTASGGTLIWSTELYVNDATLSPRLVFTAVLAPSNAQSVTLNTLITLNSGDLVACNLLNANGVGSPAVISMNPVSIRLLKVG